MTWHALKRGTLALWVAVALWSVLTGADRYLYTHGLLPVRPVVLTGTVLASVFLLAIGRDMWLRFGVGVVSVYRFNAPLILGLFFLTVVQTVGTFHPGAYWEDGGYMALQPLWMFLVYLLILPASLIPGVVQHRSLIIGAAFLGLVVTLVWDVVAPGTFNPRSALQAAGLAENPNNSVVLLLAMAILLTNGRSRAWQDWGIWGATVALIFSTGSRSGLLAWITAFGLWGLLSRSRSGWNTSVIGIFVGFATVVIFVVLLRALISIQEDSAVFIIQKLATLVDPETLAKDVRATLFWQYVDTTSRSPLVGSGAWFWLRNELGPHNMYLMMWASYGIGGIMVALVFVAGGVLTFQKAGDVRGIVFVVAIFLVLGLFQDMILVRKELIAMLALEGSFAWALRPLAGPSPSAGPDLGKRVPGQITFSPSMCSSLVTR